MITFEPLKVGVQDIVFDEYIPLVEFEQPGEEWVFWIKSPKSCAFPSVAIVIKSIVFVFVDPPPVFPPAKSPRVDELTPPPGYLLPIVRSP